MFPSKMGHAIKWSGSMLRFRVSSVQALTFPSLFAAFLSTLRHPQHKYIIVYAIGTL